MNLDDFAAALSPAKVAEILAQRAAVLAEDPRVQQSGETVQLLVFWLNEERYAFEVREVRAIYPYAPLTPVPRTPAFIKGLFNARGQILPVLDLALLLGLASFSDEAKEGHIILLSHQPADSQGLPIEVGLLVDRVMDVMMIFTGEINPPLLTQSLAAPYIRGITTTGIMVLDPAELLMDEQLLVNEEIT